MKIRVFLAITLLTTRAFAADPPIQAIPPGDDKIVVVKEREAAPFTGQLFDGATALRWANWLQQYQTRLQLLEQHGQEVCDAKLAYDAKAAGVELTRTSAIERDLRERLLAADKSRIQAEYEEAHPSWYRTVWFGAGVGIVATLAVTYVAAQAVSAK